MISRQEWVRSKAGKDRGCISLYDDKMRWCLSTLGSPEYILPVAQSISVTPLSPYAPRRLPSATLSGGGGEKQIFPSATSATTEESSTNENASWWLHIDDNLRLYTYNRLVNSTTKKTPFPRVAAVAAGHETSFIFCFDTLRMFGTYQGPGRARVARTYISEHVDRLDSHEAVQRPTRIIRFQLIAFYVYFHAGQRSGMHPPSEAGLCR